MKTTGTLLEWIKHNPNTILTHPKLQESVEVSGFKYYPQGIEYTYYSHYPDGEPMTPFFGNQMPYICKGKVNFTANVVYGFSGCGTIQPIADSLAKDDQWREV